MDQKKLTECLEILCQNGCEAVNATIEAMEKNQSFNLTESLSDDEQTIILHELKTIMSVYKH